MSWTQRSGVKRSAAIVELDSQEALFLAELIEKHSRGLLLSCASYLRQYTDRRKADRRKNK